MAYFNPYQNQYSNPYQQYQQPMYQTQPQVVYHPLTYVNGIEGAKAFIVNAGQTIYLMDSDSNTLFIKTADMQGRYEIKSFSLIQSGLDNNRQTPADYITKEDLTIFKQELLKVLKGDVKDE
jgi:hypothetical protein